MGIGEDSGEVVKIDGRFAVSSPVRTLPVRVDTQLPMHMYRWIGLGAFHAAANEAAG